MPRHARQDAPGHRPHNAGTALAQDYTGRLTGWGVPCRAEPTRQEPALLSNHDGAAAPGPARLCNDLKQEGRPQAPTPVRGGTTPGTWNLEHLSTSQPLSTSPHLDWTQPRLDSTRLTTRLSPNDYQFSTLTSFLPTLCVSVTLALVLAGPVSVLSPPVARHTRDVPHPPETKRSANACCCLLLLLQTSRPPDGTWLNAGSVMLCLTWSLIAHQPLLSTREHGHSLGGPFHVRLWLPVPKFQQAD